MSHPAPLQPVLRLLLVDDDATDRLAVRRALRDGSVRADCTEVEEAQAALDALRGAPFDCVLLDYNLPGRDGLWVLERLHEAGLRVPVVVLTGQGDEQTAVELMKAGAADYLPKSGLEGQRLARAIQHALRLSRAEQEARAAAEALRRSEARFRTLVEATTKFIWIASPEGLPTAESVGWTEFTGQPMEEYLQGQWLRCIHPDDRDRVVSTWAAALAQTASFSMEMRLRRRDGTYAWVQTRGVPHLALDGTVTEWLGTIADISARKRQEEEARKRAEFEQQLVGIVSHDLRNPISAMMMSASVLLARPGLDAQMVRTLGRIRSSGERAIRMIRDLLDFTQARLGGGIPIQRRTLDLHELAQQVVDEVRPGFPGREVLLEREGDGAGEWDPDRLAQILSNLLGNALAYSPAGTPVRVATRGVEGAVVLEVHNLGAPIAPEVLPALFEPFKRGPGREAGNGRSIGLGLYIVAQLVSAHGGGVEVASSAEAGTTFRVRLPRESGALLGTPRAG